MYQLGSLLIFGKKLISVYVAGCIKNVLLSISKNSNGCLGMLFPALEVFTSIKSYWFWYKWFISNSLGVTWKFCLRNFKNSEIDCIISQMKKHSLFELQKFKIKIFSWIMFRTFYQKSCWNILKHFE